MVKRLNMKHWAYDIERRKEIGNKISKNDGFQVSDVIILFIGIIVAVSFYTIIIQTLGGSCGVIT